MCSNPLEKHRALCAAGTCRAPASCQADIDQEEPSQGSPTLGGLKRHPCIRNGWNWAQQISPLSSPSLGSERNVVILEHPLPQQTGHKEGPAGMGQHARASAWGNRGAAGCAASQLAGMSSETRFQPLSQTCLPLSDVSPQPLGSRCPRRDPK